MTASTWWQHTGYGGGTQRVCVCVCVCAFIIYIRTYTPAVFGVPRGVCVCACVCVCVHAWVGGWVGVCIKCDSSDAHYHAHLHLPRVMPLA